MIDCQGVEGCEKNHYVYQRRVRTQVDVASPGAAKMKWNDEDGEKGSDERGATDGDDEGDDDGKRERRGMRSTVEEMMMKTG